VLAEEAARFGLQLLQLIGEIKIHAGPPSPRRPLDHAACLI
jgi:hypothetical protein